ncbi:hypothetical protein LINPERPRIM_LOCUS12361, partial [Linum perenne]
MNVGINIFDKLSNPTIKSLNGSSKVLVHGSWSYTMTTPSFGPERAIGAESVLP